MQTRRVMFHFTTITDLVRDADRLRPRSHGVIEVADERLVRVVLRPWPKTVSLLDVWFDRAVRHRLRPGNRCLLYFNQPARLPDYLTLRYVVSSADTTLGTFHGALEVLDEIARIKRTQAIVCDASNRRISARLLARWGWEPHCASRWHRHYIKRFYERPAAPLANPRLLSATSEATEGDRRRFRAQVDSVVEPLIGNDTSPRAVAAPLEGSFTPAPSTSASELVASSAGP